MRVINQALTGPKIFDLIKDQGYSVSEISDVLGLSIRAIYKWRYGLCLPTIDHLVDLSGLLDVPIEALLVIEER